MKKTVSFKKKADISGTYFVLIETWWLFWLVPIYQRESVVQ